MGHTPAASRASWERRRWRSEERTSLKELEREGGREGGREGLIQWNLIDLNTNQRTKIKVQLYLLRVPQICYTCTYTSVQETCATNSGT